MKELEKNFDPSVVEDRLYAKWLEKKYFHTEVDKSKKPFTIVMPPPNITGQLHMGHALDNTMQDILIRWKRMAGYNALWIPGIDHASISTELKVVQKMASEGLTKDDVGREGFLERAWAWKEEYGGIISCGNWVALVTGTECVLPWTKVVPMRFWKYSVVCMKKDIFIVVKKSSTGVQNVKQRYLMQK